MILLLNSHKNFKNDLAIFYNTFNMSDDRWHKFFHLNFFRKSNPNPDYNMNVSVSVAGNGKECEKSPLLLLQKVKWFSGCFYNIWDYLKTTWTFKEAVYINSAFSSLEYVFVPLLKKYLTGVLVKEHFVEFLVKDFWNFHTLLSILKKSSLSQINLFSDLFGRECFFKGKNVILMYNLVSELTNTRFLFRIVLKDSFIMLSITDIFVSAAWVERECWDMLGVVFLGNKDLRRILTDYGFLGHPLRKEFPLTGFVEVRYNDSLKRIVFEPVEFAQEMRAFDFSNPWNQAVSLSVSEGGLVNKYKAPSGGEVDFMGVLSNVITKTTFEAGSLKNFRVRNVFSSSSLFKEYLRDRNAIYLDISSNFYFNKIKSQALHNFFTKCYNISNLFKNHLCVFQFNSFILDHNKNRVFFSQISRPNFGFGMVFVVALECFSDSWIKRTFFLTEQLSTYDEDLYFTSLYRTTQIKINSRIHFGEKLCLY